MVWEVIQEMERVPQTQDSRQETQAPPNSTLKRLETRHNKTTLLMGRKFCAMYVPLNTKKQE
jgi:hypothetical protein